MSRIKIFLDKDQTPEQAKEDLKKAIEASSPEAVHTEKFHDSAAEDILAKMEDLHRKTLNKILEEVYTVIR
jgi:hypothetical protein